MKLGGPFLSNSIPFYKPNNECPAKMLILIVNIKTVSPTLTAEYVVVLHELCAGIQRCKGCSEGSGLTHRRLTLAFYIAIYCELC